MGRFPFFNRLLLAILFWPTSMISGGRILSTTRNRGVTSFRMLDDVKSISTVNPFDEEHRFSAFTSNLKNVTFIKMEKAVLLFPNIQHCSWNDTDRNHIWKEIAERYEKYSNGKGICKTSVDEDLKFVAENWFLGKSCNLSWAGIAGSYYTEENKRPEFRTYRSSGGHAQVIRTGAKDYLLEISVEGEQNERKQVLFVDHLIVGGVPVVSSNGVQLTDGEPNKIQQTGHLFNRFYAQGIRHQSGSQLKVEDVLHKGFYSLDYTGCNDVFFVARFFQAFANVFSSGWATSPGMIVLYVFLALMSVSVGGFSVFTWIRKVRDSRVTPAA